MLKKLKEAVARLRGDPTNSLFLADLVLQLAGIEVQRQEAAAAELKRLWESRGE